jgi:hypothetical protein
LEIIQFKSFDSASIIAAANLEIRNHSISELGEIVNIISYTGESKNSFLCSTTKNKVVTVILTSPSGSNMLVKAIHLVSNSYSTFDITTPPNRFDENRTVLFNRIGPCHEIGSTID